MDWIIEALRNSPKGRLQYARHRDNEKLERELSQLSPPPLSRHHEEKESSKLNLSFGLDPADFENTSNNKSDYNENSCWYKSPGKSSQSFGACCPAEIEKSDVSKEDILNLCDPGASSRFIAHRVLPDTVPLTRHGPSSPTSRRHALSSPVSSEFGYTSCAIHDAEKMWEGFTQLALAKKLDQFQHHSRALDFLICQKSQEVENKLAQQADYRQSLVDQRQQEGLEESNKRQQRLRERHEESRKKTDSRHREIEKKREILEEEKRKRQEQNALRLENVRSLLQELNNNYKEFSKLYDNFPHKDELPETIGKLQAFLEKVCAERAALVLAAESSPCVPENLIMKLEMDRDKSGQTVQILKNHIEEAEARKRVEEEKKKEAEKKKADEQQKLEIAKKLEAEAAQDLGVQSLAYILKEKDAKAKKLAEVDTVVHAFVANTQLKKFRFDLQKAVNTPINAISGVSGPHLWDKLKRLYALLNREMVEVSDKMVSIKDSPEGLLFCLNLVAKMLVKKGEEQVMSKHESAFAVGAVVVAMWVGFPQVGELFMAHLHAVCPYVLPFYATQQEGQSSADYHRDLGYKINEDGGIEEQDKFLRRMSGLMRLYCACMVVVPPPQSNAPHPHGVENAWMWLARTLSLEPHPDITAAMIHDVLAVTGHALFRLYRIQFVKMLYALYKEYLPKLKSVSVTNATVGRLELFLERAVKDATIPPPEGILPADFWTSRTSS